MRRARACAGCPAWHGTVFRAAAVPDIHKTMRSMSLDLLFMTVTNVVVLHVRFQL